MAHRTPGFRLSLRGISKRYASVIANDGIDLAVPAGQIHGLLGENGAGKSTLMRIIYGLTALDAGTIEWEGTPVQIRSPVYARRLGIAMVFQHLALFETLTVAENLALSLGEGMPAVQLAQRIETVGARYGLPIDPHQHVHQLSLGERQRVEIVRCLLQSPRLLVMDEPTSILPPQAAQALFETLRRLAAEGVSILYSSHKLAEVRALCDVATVLRDGRVVGTVTPRAESDASLARLMVGADLTESRSTAPAPGAVQLELDRLSLPALELAATPLQQISLRVRGGEIVGLAGISGNGQRELLAAISGERLCPLPDNVRLCGQAVGHWGPEQRRRLGLRYVPEERLGRGAVPSLDLADNCVLTGAGAGLSRHGIIRASVARAFARSVIAQFAVRCSSELAAASTLSGGSLQRFIMGREILFRPRVMVASQPTWGVDVAASQLIHRALFDLRAQGAAVLVFSEELEELFALCDSIAVLARGRLSPAVPTSALSPETVGLWMGGSFEGEASTVHAPDAA